MTLRRTFGVLLIALPFVLLLGVVLYKAGIVGIDALIFTFVTFAAMCSINAGLYLLDPKEGS